MTHSHFLSTLAPVPYGVLEGTMGSTSQWSHPAGVALCLLVGYPQSQGSPALMWELGCSGCLGHQGSWHLNGRIGTFDILWC